MSDRMPVVGRNEEHRRFGPDADFGHPTATVQRSPKGRSGVHIRFPNGWVVSVQWGPANYSSNRCRGVPIDAPGLEADTAEIAAWKDDGDMIAWPDGRTVQGWQSWDDVQRVLDSAERGELPVRS